MYEINASPTVEVIFEKYYKTVYNYVFYRLLHREDTEDVVSQVFTKVVAAYPGYDASKASVKTWIFRITDNTLTDFYRRRRPGVSLDDEESGLENTLSVDFDEQYEQLRSPRRRELYAALRQLPERDREFVFLKYFDGMTNRDIAKMLDMNESTVGAVLMRARSKLRQLLDWESL